MWHHVLMFFVDVTPTPDTVEPSAPSSGSGSSTVIGVLGAAAITTAGGILIGRWNNRKQRADDRADGQELGRVEGKVEALTDRVTTVEDRVDSLERRYPRRRSHNSEPSS